METNFIQRWREGNARFILKEIPFNPRHYDIAEIDEKPAKDYVVSNHYARSFPSARKRFGLFSRGGHLSGVIVFSHPMSDKVLKPFGGKPTESVELGRMVLDDSVGFNAESYFASYCFRQLRAEGFRGVISFSDDFIRTDIAGKIIFFGHLGSTYAGCNGIYTGRASRNTIHLLPDGRMFSRRAISKIRNSETGAEYASRQLINFGADPMPEAPEDRREWLTFWMSKLTRKMRHPGNHRYLFPLHKSLPMPRRLPYPKIKYQDLQMPLAF